MSKPSSGPTDRNFGLDHINGKGDKTRVTNVKAYHENFDCIDWSPKSPKPAPLKSLRQIEEAEHDWRMGL